VIDPTMRDLRVLVTDGGQRPALAITRSLGRRGVSVLVGEHTESSLASVSRYCAGHVRYPSPEQERTAFERFLLGFARRGEADVIVPVTDVAMHAVASNHDALRHSCAAVCPPFTAFETVTNKWSLFQLASRCGVPVPATCLVQSGSDLSAHLGSIEYPAVVKSTRSRVRADHGWLPTTVYYAQSSDELCRLYDQVEWLSRYPSLIQQRIVGPGLAIFVLCDHGELLTTFAHRRLREKPPSGGASVLCESVAVDPRLREFAIRLLGPLGWHGVAMLEFKQDRRTGDLFLMEVNGRFWGSLELAIAAGIDFPYLTCQLALGKKPQAPQAYRIGVKNRWLLGDLDHLFIRLAHRARDLNLADSVPSKLQTLRDFLKFVEPGLHYEIVSGDDPAPFLYEFAQYFKTAAKGIAQRMRPAVAGGPNARRTPALETDVATAERSRRIGRLAS
jgi:predicted ATP-grasp superfamily ATP-dependent carboligase